MDNLYEEVNGLDVFIRMFGGEIVQYFDGETWKEAKPFDWGVSDLNGGGFKFRIKRPTLKISVEIPQPFTPKQGENYWYIFPTYIDPVRQTTWDDRQLDAINKRCGCYKTEEDALLVFKALTKAIYGENN